MLAPRGRASRLARGARARRSATSSRPAELAEDELTRARARGSAPASAWRGAADEPTRPGAFRAGRSTEFERAGLRVRPRRAPRPTLRRSTSTEGRAPRGRRSAEVDTGKASTRRAAGRGRGHSDGATRAVPYAGRAQPTKAIRVSSRRLRCQRPSTCPEIFIDALIEQEPVLLSAAEGRLGECSDPPRGRDRTRRGAGFAPRSRAGAEQSRRHVRVRRSLFRNAGDYGACSRHAARAGDQSWELMLRAGNVSSLVLVGRWGEAIETADELAQSPHGHQVASMLGCALEIDCQRGDVERAKERLPPAADETEDPQVRASQALFKAFVLRAEGDPAAALDALQPAHDARKSLGIRFLTVKLCDHRGARVRLRAGRRGTSRSRARGDRRAPTR